MISISPDILRKAEVLASTPDNILIGFSPLERRIILAVRAYLKEAEKCLQESPTEMSLAKDDRHILGQAENKSPTGKVGLESEFINLMKEVVEK